MKRTICAVLSAVVLICLAACGGGGSSDDPNVGTWIGVSAEAFGMESDIKEVYPQGTTLEMKANGNCTAVFDGDKASGKWTGSGSRLTASIGGVDYPITIDGDALVFEMMQDMYVIYTKDGKAPKNRASDNSSSVEDAAAPASDEEPEPPAIEAPEPESELWIGVTVDMFGTLSAIEDAYANGVSIELFDDGTCTMVFNGDTSTGKWTGSDSDMTINVGGQEYKSSIENSVMTFEMMKDILIYFTQDGNLSSDSSADSEVPGDDPGASGGTLADAIAWWEGDWYGTFYVYDANEAYDYINGTFFDVYAVIETEPSGPATVYLWSEDTEIGTVFITISADGKGVMGTVVANGGDLFDAPVYYEDWNIDPSTCRYSNMIEIREIFTDEDGDWFDYEFLLRPWGVDWEDVPSSEQPEWYDNWYLDVYDQPMLDVLREYGEMSHSQIS